jgi:hypothetical protein
MEYGTGKSRAKYQVKFIGGPKDGEVRHEFEPATFIFPEGSDLDLVLGVLEGKKVDLAGHGIYEFDSQARVYRWRSRRN